MEYDCIFSSEVTDDGLQSNRIEFNPISKHEETNEKYLDLQNLQSITCAHGNLSKNEPRDILTLRINGKKHRLGFDNIYEYNQWKCLLDSIYNSSWDKTCQNTRDEDVSVNMLYESATGRRKQNEKFNPFSFFVFQL